MDEEYEEEDDDEFNLSKLIEENDEDIEEVVPLTNYMNNHKYDDENVDDGRENDKSIIGVDEEGSLAIGSTKISHAASADDGNSENDADSLCDGVEDDGDVNSCDVNGAESGADAGGAICGGGRDVESSSTARGRGRGRGKGTKRGRNVVSKETQRFF